MGGGKVLRWWGRGGRVWGAGGESGRLGCGEIVGIGRDGPGGPGVGGCRGIGENGDPKGRGGRQAPGSVGSRSVGGVGGAREGCGSPGIGIGLATPLVEPLRTHSASKS